MHQVLLLDVDLEVNVGTEALPAVKTQERSLASVSDQVMFETNGNLNYIGQSEHCISYIDQSRLTLNGVSHSGQILFLELASSPSIR